MARLRVGTKLYGYCGGSFGRDSYATKRVEAIGADWVVVREIEGYHNGVVRLYHGIPEDLLDYATEEEKKRWEQYSD